jgi:hypothetical protein
LTQPIHKSRSDWALPSNGQPGPFQIGSNKSGYDRNEPVYDTPSVHSLAATVPAVVNEHYYSMPAEEFMPKPTQGDFFVVTVYLHNPTDEEMSYRTAHKKIGFIQFFVVSCHACTTFSLIYVVLCTSIDL